jgi:hypothetical protein
VLASKLVQVRYFPQRVAEVNVGDQPALYAAYAAEFSQPPPVGQSLPNPNNISFTGLMPQIQQWWADRGLPAVPVGDLSQYNPTLDANRDLRSSEILFNFLTQANVLGDATTSTDAFSSSEAADTPESIGAGQTRGNGLPELIDAWGKPLRFYRWPTRLFRSGGALAASPFLAAITPYDVNNAKIMFSSLPVFSGNLANDLNRDPDDPLRICIGNANFTAVQFEQNFHTPGTYHTILIVSPGPDGAMGLFEPWDVTNSGYLAAPDPLNLEGMTDNIMYLNVRTGGK